MTRDNESGCALRAAAERVVSVHRQIIDAVTPGHPGFLYSQGPKMIPDHRDRYEALFSQWHAATRNLRDVLASEVGS